MEYGEWSDGVPVTVKVKTPDAPGVQKVQVKKNDVRKSLNSRQRYRTVTMLLLPEVKRKRTIGLYKGKEWVFRKQ